MLGKIGTCKAIKVADTSANGALLMKVVFAVTLRANVLVKRSATFAAMELAQDLNAAKLSQMAVKTAFAGRSLFVYLSIKLLNGELAVGVASKKADECFPARCFISLFSHLSSP